jgi:hypothetical protein
MTGAYLGFMKILIVNSIRKAHTNTLVGKKFPISQAFINEIRANTNKIPAAALTVRSFKTATGYSGLISPN